MMPGKDFVFCAPFISYILSDSNEDTDEDKGICVCKDTLQGFDEQDITEEILNNIIIDQILMSEGSEIYEAKQIRLSNIQVFEPFNIPGIEKLHIWHSLIKLITAGEFSMDNLDILKDSACWKFSIERTIDCNLVLEIKSEDFVKKLAQIRFSPVENTELDLFELTNQLYTGLSKTNIKYNGLAENSERLENEISTLTSERKILDKILDERDRKMKAVIVELLNEKKRKILQLQEIIDKHNLGDLIPENRSDSDLINTHIVNAVTELNSPGTRRKRTRKDINIIEKPYGSIKRKLKLEDSESSQVLNKEIKTEKNHQFTPEFNFYGISKTIDNPLPKLSIPTLNEPLVKVETPDKNRIPDDERNKSNENEKISQVSDKESNTDETDDGTDIEMRNLSKEQNPKVISDSEEETDSNASTEETDTDVNGN